MGSWFGSWPPNIVTGGNVPIDTEGNARKSAHTTFLVLLTVLGLVLVGASGYVKEYLPPEWGAHLPDIVAHIGIALLVAAVLAWIVDRSLKQDLISDAVAAAIGYLLPKQLKDELRSLYDQKFIASQTFNVRLEHFPDKKLVVFHGSYFRNVRNSSGEKAKLTIGGGIDEWLHPEMESRITKWGYTQKGKFTSIPHVKKLLNITYRGSLRQVDVDAGESVEVSMTYELPMYENGLEVLVYQYPIDNSLVTVDIPPSLVGRILYSHRTKYYWEGIPESGVIHSQLDGMLLPHQVIMVIWHLADSVEKRKAALSQSA
jgi:hypothetical protein